MPLNIMTNTMKIMTCAITPIYMLANIIPSMMRKYTPKYTRSIPQVYPAEQGRAQSARVFVDIC